MMRAITIKKPGGADVLQMIDTARPEPHDGEILIAVKAAGINRPDILQREGHYPPPKGASPLPGLEVAGIVAESRSPLWQKGDKVVALTNGGGYAEYVRVPAQHALPMPETLSFIEGAALPECLFTVVYNLFMRSTLRKGERILIHGGTSGIGTTAIQLAKSVDTEVAVTAGSDDKCKSCEDLGAVLAVNYKKNDFQAAIEERFGKQPLDKVLDMVGGDYVARNLSLLRDGGHHISIAFQKEAKAEINMASIMLRRLTLTGSTLRPRTKQEKAEIAQKIHALVWPLIENGAFRPVIDITFPLADAAAAHRHMESGAHIGKIILHVDA